MPQIGRARSPAPDELGALMGKEQAALALRGFEADAWTQRMSGPLPRDSRIALGQIESTAYLRNQLLRDSDWASMDHSVELRTPLVDAWLLADVQALMPAFQRVPNKTLLAEAPLRPLPHEIINRSKTGFGIPVGRWLADRAKPTGKTIDSWSSPGRWASSRSGLAANWRAGSTLTRSGGDTTSSVRGAGEAGDG